MKKEIVNYLKENAIEIFELSLENNENDDYPDFAFELGKVIKEEKALGILICGNGIGMSIAANKIKGVRAARALSIDDAFKAKNHNGANVLALSANMDLELTLNIVDTFIATKNPSEERYLRRIEKIKNYEDE